MLIIELRFVACRFHATPWGRHVNEAVPEWPPSPFRLLRGVVDTWRRKFPAWPAERLLEVVVPLAAELPLFELPAATASHVRSYMSVNGTDPADKALLFDAFVALSPDAIVRMGWPAASLDAERKRDLEALLDNLAYLGRAESWIHASVSEQGRVPDWNCAPLHGVAPAGADEVVRVACPVPVSPGKADTGWLDDLCWTSAQVLKAGRSEPPGLRMIDYVRRSDCLIPSRRGRRGVAAGTVNGVLYALAGQVLPRVTETLEVAERLRSKLMGIHKRVVGDPSLVSQRFSGKDSAGNPLRGHRHLHILPQDRDGDGRIEHVLVLSTEALAGSELLALDRADSLWQRGGRPDVRLVPVQWGRLDDLQASTSVLRSATPFVPTRHFRRGRGRYEEWLVSELRRALEQHGLPEPVRIRTLPELELRHGRVRWSQFTLARKEDTRRRGHGFEIELARPVLAPCAVGYGAHFGLGQLVERP